MLDSRMGRKTLKRGHAGSVSRGYFLRVLPPFSQKRRTAPTSCATAMKNPACAAVKREEEEDWGARTRGQSWDKSYAATRATAYTTEDICDQLKSRHA